MNVLEYSLKLGRLLQETEEGKIFLQLKSNVDGKYKSNNDFRQYENIVERDSSKYYFYSWDLAYKQMAEVLENDSISHRELFIPAAQLATSDKDIVALTKMAGSFGDLFEKIVAAIISGADYEEVTPKPWRFNIKNAISDVQIAVERTLLPREIATYYNQHGNLLKDPFIQKYLDSRGKENLLPFSDEAIKRMNNAKDISDDAKILFEKLYLIIAVVKRGIFYGFLEMITEIPKDKVLIENDLYGVPLHEVAFSYKDSMSFSFEKSWIYKIQIEDGYKYFLAYKKRVSILEETNTISGIIYPANDRRLFETETAT